MLLCVTFPILLNVFLSWCGGEVRKRGKGDALSCASAALELGRLSSALQGFDFGLVCLCIVLAGTW